MTLGPSPGILEDFGAVRSSTTPSGDVLDGAAASDGAKGGRFGDLVEAWLSPVPDENDADDSAEAVPAAVVPPFPIALPLPVIAHAPQAQADAPEAVEGDCANACADASPAEPRESPALTPHMAPTVAIGPTSAQRTEAVASSPRSEGTSAQKTPQREASSGFAHVQVTKAADAGADDQGVRHVRELPGLTSAVPSGRAPANDPPKSEGFDVDVPARESSQAATVRDSIPPPPARSVTAFTEGANSPSSAPSVETESISPSPAAGPGLPARAADAGLRAHDAVVKATTETESAKSSTGSVQKPAPREADAPYRPAEKPNVPHTKGDAVRKPSRVPSKIDLSSTGAVAPKLARTAIPQSAEVVTTPAIEDVGSPAALNSEGQDVAVADAPRRSSNLQGPREPVTPSAVVAAAVKGNVPDVHAQSIVPAEIGTSREAPSSGDPQSADGPRGSKGVAVAQSDGRGRSETSDERDRQENREAASRDSADRTPGIARSNLSQPFVERGESREFTASPSPPARPSITQVHGTAPVLTQATLLQPPTVASSDAPATVTPAPDTADRIVQSLKLQVQRGGGDAVLHLQPEHLGPVAISLRVENGSVSAVITAEHPAVAEWLQSNQQSLRDGLQASGLTLERFVVQRDGQSPSDRQRREWVESRRRDLRRRSPQTDSTFEISV